MAEESNAEVFVYTVGAVVPEDVVHVRVHPSITIIPEQTFYKRQKLEAVELCGGLLEIGEAAFMDCKALKKINMPSTVTKIHSYALQFCDTLETVELCEGLLEIGKQAFNYCVSLKSISIPSTVNFIGDRAFYNTQIISISLPDGVQNVEMFAFCRTKVLKFRLPPLITSIPRGSFSVCIHMLSVELPENIGDIKPVSFNLNRTLRNIAIPLDAKVRENSNENVFGRCTNLKQLFDTEEQIINALKHRFENLPIHKMIYYQSYNNMTSDELNNVTDMRRTQKRSLRSKLDPTGSQQDCLGMTPLHIMACSTVQNVELYRILIDKYPESLITKDRWGALPLLYAVWGDAPDEIVQFLIESYKSLYPDREMNWTEMVETLAKDAPLKVIQNLLEMHKHHFPTQLIDWDQLFDKLNVIYNSHDEAQSLRNERKALSDKVFKHLLKYSEAVRISAIGLRQWRDDITNEIETTKCDDEFLSFRATIQSKISEYEARYQELKEATTVIELVLWKNKISEASKSTKEEGGSKKKMKFDQSAICEQCRYSCGADVVIEYVLPYLISDPAD